MGLDVRKLLGFLRKYQDPRRQYFDENLQADAWDLLHTAALLEVTEFAVFELAYKDWYGRRPPPHVMESHFANYMFSNVIPVWVRRYARHVVELNEQGKLNPRELGVYKRLPSKRLSMIGKAYAVVILVALLILTFMAYRDTEVFRSFTTNESITSPQHHAMP